MGISRSIEESDVKCIEGNGINVVLVNTISQDFLHRYQAPLAINVLARYVEERVCRISVFCVDMQGKFDKINSSSSVLSVEEMFQEVVRTSVHDICDIARTGPTIVGLSIKWAAVDVAEAIVEKVRACFEGQVLYVLGNIGATFGYKDLLKVDSFKNALAVVGEGEEALTSIVKMALSEHNNFANASLYSDIPNVATENAGEPTVKLLERVDLEQYPVALSHSDDLYDTTLDVYCLETSRGCPWGACTFCSVNKQFGEGENGGWKSFPVATVLENIKHLVAQGARNFDIKDSEFFGSVRKNLNDDPFWETMTRAREIAQGIEEINTTLEDGDKVVIHHLSARVDTIYRTGEDAKNLERKEVYRLLKNAGVNGVYLGIESGSPSQLKRFSKGITVEENKKALEILKELGLQREVGFVFFDYCASMQELQESVEFIEQTLLYKTNSRLFGSLRVQEGSNYKKIAQKHKLLGSKNKDHLVYECEFLNENVGKLEKMFVQWEESTVQLIKILTLELALEVREMNFMIMKELLEDFIENGGSDSRTIINCFMKKRKKFLDKVKNDHDVKTLNSDNSQLLKKHIEYAERKNEELVYKIDLLCGNDDKR